MKIGIISDIHGNAEALQAVLSKLQDVQQCFCLGDIVGYGADPSYCIEKMRALGIPSIKGNHEGAVVGELDLNYFNEDARQAVQWTRKQLKDPEYHYLKQLARKMAISESENILGVHGSPRQPLWEYILDEQTAEEIFHGFDFKIYFVGHSHIAGYFTFHRKNQVVHYFSATGGAEIAIRPNHSYIINCGSVGQPRDRNPQASLAIFDTDRITVHIIRIEYPVNKAQDKIIRAQLPRFLAGRLALGI